MTVNVISSGFNFISEIRKHDTILIVKLPGFFSIFFLQQGVPITIEVSSRYHGNDTQFS